MASSWHGLGARRREALPRRGRKPQREIIRGSGLGGFLSGDASTTTATTMASTVASRRSHRSPPLLGVKRTLSAPLRELAAAATKSAPPKKTPARIAGPMMMQLATVAASIKPGMKPISEVARSKSPDDLSEAFQASFPDLMDFNSSASVVTALVTSLGVYPTTSVPVAPEPSPTRIISTRNTLGLSLFGRKQPNKGVIRTKSAPLANLARAAMLASGLARTAAASNNNLGHTNPAPPVPIDHEQTATKKDTPLDEAAAAALVLLAQKEHQIVEALNKEETEEVLEMPILGRASSAPFDMFAEFDKESVDSVPERSSSYPSIYFGAENDPETMNTAKPVLTKGRSAATVSAFLDRDLFTSFPSASFDLPDFRTRGRNDTNTEVDNSTNSAHQRNIWHHTDIPTDETFEAAKEDEKLDKHKSCHGFSFNATYSAAEDDATKDEEGCGKDDTTQEPRIKRIRERPVRRTQSHGQGQATFRRTVSHGQGKDAISQWARSIEGITTSRTTEKKETTLELRRIERHKMMLEELAHELSEESGDDEDDFAEDENVKDTPGDLSANSSSRLSGSGNSSFSSSSASVLQQMEGDRSKTAGKKHFRGTTRIRHFAGQPDQDQPKETHKEEENQTTSEGPEHGSLGTSVTGTASDSSLMSEENAKMDAADSKQSEVNAGILLDGESKGEDAARSRSESLEATSSHNTSKKKRVKVAEHNKHTRISKESAKTSTSKGKPTKTRSESRRSARKKKGSRDSNCSLELSDLELSNHDNNMHSSDRESQKSRRGRSSKSSSSRLSQSDPGKSMRRSQANRHSSKSSACLLESLHLDTVLENNNEDASEAPSKVRKHRKSASDHISSGTRSVSSSGSTIRSKGSRSEHSGGGSPAKHGRRSIGNMHSADSSDEEHDRVLAKKKRSVKTKQIRSNNHTGEHHDRQLAIPENNSVLPSSSRSTLPDGKNNSIGVRRSSDRDASHADQSSRDGLPPGSKSSSSQKQGSLDADANKNVARPVESLEFSAAKSRHPHYMGEPLYEHPSHHFVPNGQGPRLHRDPRMHQYNDCRYHDPYYQGIGDPMYAGLSEHPVMQQQGRYMPNPQHYRSGHEGRSMPNHPRTIHEDFSPHDYGSGDPHNQHPAYHQYPTYNPDPFVDRRAGHERYLASIETNQHHQRAAGGNYVEQGPPRNEGGDDSLHSTIYSQRESSRRGVRRRHSIGSGHSRDTIMHEVTLAMEQENRNTCNHCCQAVSRCRCNVFHHNMEPLIDMSHHARAHAHDSRQVMRRDMESRFASRGAGHRASLFDTFGIRTPDDFAGTPRHLTDQRIEHRMDPRIDNRRGMPHPMIDNEMHSAYRRPYNQSSAPLYGRPFDDDVHDYVHLSNTQRLSGSVSANNCHRGRVFQRFAHPPEEGEGGGARDSSTHHRRKGFASTSRNAAEDKRRSYDDGSLRYPPRQLDRKSVSGRRSVFDDGSFRSFAI